MEYPTVILEAIVTTLNEDGRPNISPMGPRVDSGFQQFVLRPFQTSTTYRNLKRSREGVLHVTDDVELLARCAVGKLETLPTWRASQAVNGVILEDACRWYAFQVEELDDREPRTSIACRVVDRGVVREFFGFNRAKHAVVEAAILATRLQFLSPELVREEFERLAVLVEKTAGDQERRAFEFLLHYVDAHRESSTASGGR